MFNLTGTLHATAGSAPGWYAVAGAIGGALLVSAANQLIAKRQRAAESKRLERQLEHDRVARAAEAAAADTRLARQLAHDRELRDLHHLRLLVGPIVSRVVNASDPRSRFTPELQRLNEMSPERRELAVTRFRADLAEEQEKCLRDAAMVTSVLGPESSLAGALVALGRSTQRYGR